MPRFVVPIPRQRVSPGRDEMPPLRTGSLTEFVLGLVVGHHDESAVGDNKPVDVDAAPRKPRRLLDEHLGIDHHAVGDDRELAGVEDPDGTRCARTARP